MMSKLIGLAGVFLIAAQGVADYYSKIQLNSDLSVIRSEIHQAHQELKGLKKQVQQLKVTVEKDLSEIMECDPIVN